MGKIKFTFLFRNNIPEDGKYDGLISEMAVTKRCQWFTRLFCYVIIRCKLKKDYMREVHAHGICGSDD